MLKGSDNIFFSHKGLFQVTPIFGLKENKENPLFCKLVKLICDSFLAKDCAHGCYKAHPYCEPCGKSDYSWNYLIDELKESAGQWLSREAVIMYWSGDKNFQKIGQDCNPTSTISSFMPTDPTRTTTIETTEGQFFSIT